MRLALILETIKPEEPIPIHPRMPDTSTDRKEEEEWKRIQREKKKQRREEQRKKKKEVEQHKLA